MTLFTLHGLFFIIPWYFEGHLIARVCCITIHFLHGRCMVALIADSLLSREKFSTKIQQAQKQVLPLE
jgi:hypothetical protein